MGELLGRKSHHVSYLGYVGSALIQEALPPNSIGM
jgi:hypothetical protein